MEDFRQNFVDAFDKESNRQELFENYTQYMNNFSSLISKDYFQWIDGSYVSNKKRPGDIDLVTVIDYRDYEKNKSIFEKEFASLRGRKKYNVDAYIGTV